MRNSQIGKKTPRVRGAMMLAIGLAASALAQSSITEVVGGLHSPRGLAIGPGVQLCVAQAADDTVDGSIIEIISPILRSSRRTAARPFRSGLSI
jgi:hypothetical protein